MPTIGVRLEVAVKPTLVPDVQLALTAPKRALAETLASFRVSRAHEDPNQALSAKLEQLFADPRRKAELSPQRDSLRLRAGEIEAVEKQGALHMVLPAKTPGLLSVKLTVLGTDSTGAPIQRTSRVSFLIEPGKPDPKASKVGLVKLAGDLSGLRVDVTPRSASGHLLGPGRASEFAVLVGGKEVAAEIHDDLDGTYRINVRPAKDLRGVVSLSMDGVALWRGKL
jgi:hypothetical protein